jgi:nucleotide-binding universal stress UspA family protein
MVTICSRIVVPYDHSDCSKKALQMAMNLAKQDKEIELNVVMVVQPQYPYGIPYSYALTK